MPNWCSNTIMFDDANGNEENVRLFYEMIERAMQKGRELKSSGQTEADPTWYGNIITEVGLSPNDYECRGFVEDYQDPSEYDGVAFNVWSSTAWSPQMEGIDAIVKKFNKDNDTHIRFYYSSEEPGFEIYENNDATGDVFNEGYIVDDLDDDTHYLDFEDDIYDWLNSAYGTNFINETTDEINKYFQDKGKEVYVHRFEVNPEFIQEEA